MIIKQCLVDNKNSINVYYYHFHYLEAELEPEDPRSIPSPALTDTGTQSNHTPRVPASAGVHWPLSHSFYFLRKCLFSVYPVSTSV